MSKDFLESILNDKLSSKLRTQLEEVLVVFPDADPDIIIEDLKLSKSSDITIDRFLGNPDLLKKVVLNGFDEIL